MIKFNVSSLTTELYGQIEILEDFSFCFHLMKNDAQPVIQGFFAMKKGDVDFIVAKNNVTISGINAPDWSGDKIIGLNGRVFNDESFDNATIVDFIVVRRFAAYSSGKCLVRKWYVPHWKDWILPADSLMPWGATSIAILAFK